MPGVTAKGRLATSPHMSVEMALERAVLVVTSCMGKPGERGKGKGGSKRGGCTSRSALRAHRVHVEMALERAVLVTSCMGSPEIRRKRGEGEGEEGIKGS